MQTEIRFSFPLTRKVVRHLRIETEQIGILQIEGYAYPTKGYNRLDPLDEQFVIDLDFINYNGTDIKPILDTFSETLSEEIHKKALEEAVNSYYYPEPQIPDEPEDVEDFLTLVRIMNLYPAA